jgi:hypothetical protein
LNYFKLQIWPYWWFLLVRALNHHYRVLTLHHWPEPIWFYGLSICIQSSGFV